MVIWGALNLFVGLTTEWAANSGSPFAKMAASDGSGFRLVGVTAILIAVATKTITSLWFLEKFLFTGGRRHPVPLFFLYLVGVAALAAVLLFLSIAVGTGLNRYDALAPSQTARASTTISPSAGTGSGTSASSTSEVCYAGLWRENEPNGLTWNVRRDGDRLRIARTDGFVSGEFTWRGTEWFGVLRWGTGDVWQGVVLHEPSGDCQEIRTNQRWWFRR
jgi:hypothetical protein